MADWYYAMGEERIGPVNGAALKQLALSGKITPETLIWKEGLAQWVAAKKVKGLFPQQVVGATPPAQDPNSPPPKMAIPPVIKSQPPLSAADVSSHEQLGGDVANEDFEEQKIASADRMAKIALICSLAGVVVPLILLSLSLYMLFATSPSSGTFRSEHFMPSNENVDYRTICQVLGYASITVGLVGLVLAIVALSGKTLRKKTAFVAIGLFAGMVLFYSATFFVVFKYLVPRAQKAKSALNMAIMAKAIALYQGEDVQYAMGPANFEMILYRYKLPPECLVSPASGKKAPKVIPDEKIWPPIRLEGDVDYIYSPVFENAPGETLIMYENPQNYDNSGTNVLTQNMTISWVDMETFRKMLEEATPHAEKMKKERRDMWGGAYTPEWIDEVWKKGQSYRKPISKGANIYTPGVCFYGSKAVLKRCFDLEKRSCDAEIFTRTVGDIRTFAGKYDWGSHKTALILVVQVSGELVNGPFGVEGSKEVYAGAVKHNSFIDHVNVKPSPGRIQLLQEDCTAVLIAAFSDDLTFDPLKASSFKFTIGDGITVEVPREAVFFDP